MVVSGKGSRPVPPHAARRTERESNLRMANLRGSEPRPGQRRQRQPGKRIVEKVFVRAVVEEVSDLEVHPERAGDAHSRAGVEQELRRQEGGLELIARHRRGVVRLRVPLDAVALSREAAEDPMWRSVRKQVSAALAGAKIDGLEIAVGDLGDEA